MAERGYAIAAYRDAGQWRCEPLPPSVLGSLDVLLQALRSQAPEGGPFVMAGFEEEFFLIARQHGHKTALMLSDLTAAVDFPLAAQVLERLGEDPPEDDELDESLPVGDLDLFTDLDLSEDEMEQLFEDEDAYPDEMLEAIVSRVGAVDSYTAALRSALASAQSVR